jgi:hypothetical protein
MPDRLETVLRSLADEIDYPPTPNLAATLPARLDAERARPRGWFRLTRPMLLAAALVLLLVATVGALTFILPGLRLSVLPSLPATPVAALGDALALGVPASPATVEGSGPALLGPPAAAYLAQDGDVVSLVYAAGDGLPEIGDSGIGLLVQRIGGSLERERIEKLVVEVGASVTPVEVGDDAGFWIEGPPHLVRYRGSDGLERAEMSRLAGDTLVWERDGTLYRVESGLGLDATRRLAESIPP